MPKVERTPQQLRDRAQQAELAADDLSEQIEKDPTLKEPSLTDDYERVPSPALVGLGALRQAADKWRQQATRMENRQTQDDEPQEAA